MKKAEAEQAIRKLCHVWSDEVGIPCKPESEPSFFAFTAWVLRKGHGHYLNFRSTRGALVDAKLWFDQEFQQMWWD